MVISISTTIVLSIFKYLSPSSSFTSFIYNPKRNSSENVKLKETKSSKGVISSQSMWGWNPFNIQWIHQMLGCFFVLVLFCLLFGSFFFLFGNSFFVVVLKFTHHGTSSLGQPEFRTSSCKSELTSIVMIRDVRIFSLKRKIYSTYHLCKKDKCEQYTDFKLASEVIFPLQLPGNLLSRRREKWSAHKPFIRNHQEPHEVVLLRDVKRQLTQSVLKNQSIMTHHLGT